MTAVVIALLAVFASLFVVFAALRGRSRTPGHDGDASSIVHGGTRADDRHEGDGGNDGEGDGGGGD